MNTRTLIAASVTVTLLLSACARDLSGSTYTEDSTLNLTLEGKIVSVRPVVIKNADQLSQNTAGMIAGGAAGAAAGAQVGQGSGRGLAVVGGVLAGAAVGALAESELGKQDGYEYIVKVDTRNLKSDYFEGTGAMRNAIATATTSGLVTVVQGKDVVLQNGQPVYAIFSDKRVRLIAR